MDARPADATKRRPLPEQAGVGVLVLAALGCLAVDWQLAWMPAVAALAMVSSARRCVLMLAGATTLLLLVGGAVTTYRVGMAVPDWPATMGQNMFTYPLADMLEAGWGVTLEHSHRLWASLVGLLTLGVAYRAVREGVAWRRLALLAVVVVVLQGLLGGSRVLENDQDLAFLHGSFAQVFYGVVFALLVVSTRGWEQARRRQHQAAPALRRTALAATLLVYGQIVLGAWLRHSGLVLALMLHVVLAFAVVGIVLALATRLTRVAREAEGADGEALRPLATVARLMLGALAAQVLLGLGATAAIFLISQGFQGQVSWPEAVSATLHVAVGAVLLGSTVAANLWTRRLLAEPARAVRTPDALGLGAEATP